MTDVFTILIVVAISQGVHVLRHTKLYTFNVCNLVNYVPIKLLKITEQCGSNFYHLCMLVDRRKTGGMFPNMSIVVNSGLWDYRGFSSS